MFSIIVVISHTEEGAWSLETFMWRKYYVFYYCGFYHPRMWVGKSCTLSVCVSG